MGLGESTSGCISASIKGSYVSSQDGWPLTESLLHLAVFSCIVHLRLGLLNSAYVGLRFQYGNRFKVILVQTKALVRYIIPVYCAMLQHPFLAIPIVQVGNCERSEDRLQALLELAAMWQCRTLVGRLYSVPCKSEYVRVTIHDPARRSGFEPYMIWWHHQSKAHNRIEGSMSPTIVVIEKGRWDEALKSSKCRWSRSCFIYAPVRAAPSKAAVLIKSHLKIGKFNAFAPQPEKSYQKKKLQDGQPNHCFRLHRTIVTCCIT